MNPGAGRLSGRRAAASSARRGADTKHAALPALALALLAVLGVFSALVLPESRQIGSAIVDISIPPPDQDRPASVEPVFQPAPEAEAAPALLPAPSSPLPSPSPKTPVAKDKRTALIIGIGEARGAKPLPGSVTDARNLERALDLYGFAPENVTVLLNADASRGAILHHLDELARRTPADGLAVFAVATHTRQRGGVNQLLTADGGRISASELADRLAAVPAPMWIALPTCYAGGYALPGIVGPGRLTVFASEADKPTYQVGSQGSYLFIEMVREAMVEGHAPESVEAAFHYAERELRRWAPNRVPLMSDGIEGDLVLGTWSGTPPSQKEETLAAHGQPTSPPTFRRAPPPPAPSPTPTPSPRRGLRLCGSISVNCR